MSSDEENKEIEEAARLAFEASEEAYKRKKQEVIERQQQESPELSPEERVERIEESQVDPVQKAKLEVLDLMREKIKTDSSLAELGAILKEYPFVKDYLLQYVAALNYLGKGSITNLVHTVKCEPISGDKVEYTSQFSFFDKDGKEVFPEQFTEILKPE